MPQNPPDQISYTHPDRIMLFDQAAQKVIGAIDNLSIRLDGDPAVSITFAATAGAFGTTFTINSATVSFPAITNPPASADAEVTLTDTSTNGATLTLVGTNAGAFLPNYNGGTLFASLIGAQSLASGGSVTVAEGTGPQTIAGAVSSIQGRFQFTLSAADTLSGEGNFIVVPEPATIGLLVVGLAVGIAFARRRRLASHS
jgi:hypothetical protein